MISGQTGAGKSTLIRLILGLLKPQKGDITIGGQPAGSALRGNFMYIPQGNSLLSGTIRSNLQLAAPKATEEDIREFSKQSELLDLKDTSNNGLDELMEEMFEAQEILKEARAKNKK